MNSWISQLIAATAEAGPMLLLGATLLLILGSVAVALARAPIHRQRLAEGAIAAVLVWIVLALVPLPRFPVGEWIRSTRSTAAATTDREVETAASQNIGRVRSRAGGEADSWRPPAVVGDARQAISPPAAAGDSAVLDNAEAAASPIAAPSRAPIVAIPGLPVVLAAIFLLCALLCGGWLLLSRLLLARLLWQTHPPEAWLLRLYDSLPFAGNRRPALLVSAHGKSAFSCGVLRPVIVLPQEICREDHTGALRHVLLHELAHAAQRDAWGRLLLNAAFPLLFFHPLYWWLRSQASLAAELVADDCAARESSPATYAEELIALMRRQQTPALAGLGLLGVFASRSQFTRRMESLLRRERDLATYCSRVWTLSSVALSIVVVAIAAGVFGVPPTDAGADDKDIQAAKAAEVRKAERELIEARIRVLRLREEAERAKAQQRLDELQAKLARLAVATPPPGEWPQWGGSSTRNNTPADCPIPTTWDPQSGKNVKWSMPAGDLTGSTPVVAGGKVFIGSNNGAAYLARYPKDVDLGTLLCFRESDGKFLWQHSSEKLPEGRSWDWPMLGVCSSPCVEGERLWFVTNRGELLCLDTEGFLDGENDGPVTDEPNENRDESDVVWRLDMLRGLGVRPRHKFCSSPTTYGDLLFVNTSNGLHQQVKDWENPAAPSFLAVDKHTGRVIWSDNSPGEMIFHVAVSSPAVGVLDGVPQVVFGGGDGWLYSFRADRGADGKPELLWKFDCNPKTSRYVLGGQGTRNNVVTTPVIYDGLVYIAVGQEPEHGEGPGRLWCIDPTRRGDVSSELAVKASDHSQLLPRRRFQAVDESKGEAAIANPNSAVVWHYAQFDLDGDGKIQFEEAMYRSMSNATIKNGLLLITDFSGKLHCLDAKTGRLHWTYDLFAACWGTPLIVDGKVYVGDEDGDVSVFELSDKLKLLAENNVPNSVYATPIVAGGVLYIANTHRLYAIAAE